MPVPVTIVQGAFWGSEAKGAVAGWLAETRNYDYAVRTGAINAGHTVWYKGKPYVNQQLPVAWVNPNTTLVIGPGAYIHMPTLLKEIDMIREATGVDPSNRILVDHRVAIHLDSYSDESKAVNRHHLIGATGKGCAEAIVHKIVDRGKAEVLLQRVVPEVPFQWADVPELLTDSYYKGAKICLEGTQGELLDFHMGPWPYVTSRQTTPAAWVAEAGLSPSLNYEIVLVARTYPIRVAGNSGPMPNEISWPMLAYGINDKLLKAGYYPSHPLCVSPEVLYTWESIIEEEFGHDMVRAHEMPEEWREEHRAELSEYASLVLANMPMGMVAELKKLFEFTTVTKKLRRIAKVDRDGLRATVRRLNPAWVVITFLNYEFPELHYKERISRGAAKWARELCRVEAVTTGPESKHVILI